MDRGNVPFSTLHAPVEADPNSNPRQGLTLLRPSRTLSARQQSRRPPEAPANGGRPDLRSPVARASRADGFWYRREWQILGRDRSAAGSFLRKPPPL